ncbi:AI-2E family transporter [Nostocoides sp.]|uniref:AI-2E family transporter n=1 Tax=Nostocoides sp. TaxID=1917966 RepID=UPI002C5E72FB|nr:AI-2E family transporter [Tetrasphaera sp.]
MTQRHTESRSDVPHGVRAASEWSWRLLLIAAAIGLLGWLIGHLSELVVPIIVATLLAALLQPVFRRLHSVLPRGVAAAITVLGTLAVIGGLMAFVGSQFANQLPDLTDQVGEGLDQIRDWIRTTFNITDTQFTQYFERARDALTSGGSDLGGTAAKFGLTATHVVAGFFISMFALFFFLLEGPQIWAWIVRLFPRTARARVASSGAIAWSQLQAFCKATILVAAADATGIGVGAAILGVPFASGIGLLVFLGAFIPVIGALLSGIVAVLLALVALGPVKALIMLGIVIGVQQIESHVLQPFLLGRAVRVHPLAVILAIAAGVIVWGIVGALIAVPVAAVVNAVGHHLLADPEPLPPSVEATEITQITEIGPSEA